MKMSIITTKREANENGNHNNKKGGKMKMAIKTTKREAK